MTRRNKSQIIAQILEICLQSDSKKTRIVYQANTNFKAVNFYLDLLTGKRLLYKTTPAGETAL